MVALLLKAEDNDDMSAAIMTANISPTRPVGSTFNTNLTSTKEYDQQMLKRANQTRGCEKQEPKIKGKRKLRLLKERGEKEGKRKEEVQYFTNKLNLQ